MNKENTANKEPEKENKNVLHLEVKDGITKGEVVSSPLQLIFSIMACVFVIEAVIMFMLSMFPPISVVGEALIDALFLTILMTPLVYLFVYRQLNEHIKKRRAAESAQMSSAEHLRSIVESAAEPIISMDAKGCVIFWNAVAEDVFGYEREEMLGMSASIIVAEEEKEFYRQILKRSTRMGDKNHAGEVFELSALRKDGSRFPAELSIAQWNTEDGEFFTVVIRNITEQKQSRDALKERTQQQAVVAELGQLALSGIELSVLFDSAARTLVETLEVEFSKILKLLPDQKKLLLVAGAGWKDGLVGQLTLDTGLESQAGYALYSREPVIVTDLHMEERFKGAAIFRDHNVVSGMSVIIDSETQPFGVIGVHSAKNRVFTADDINFLQSVANVLAEAIRRKGTEDSFQALFSSTAESTGKEFFYKTVESLGEWLGADCALIGEFVEDNNVETVAMVLDNKRIHKFRYNLTGTPCEEVSKSGFCIYPEGVIEKFPDDVDLSELGAEGYVGVRLQNSDGEAIGILSVVSRSRMDLPPKGREIFEIIAAKVEAELERRHAEEALRENEEKYSSLFENMLNGFAYHEVVLDKDGRPVDYIFLEVNHWFETLTGLKREDIIGKRVSEVLPGIEKSEFDWIGEYGKIAIEGGELRTEQYAEPLNKWYSILGYSNKKGYFATVFEDITARKHAEEEMRKLTQAIEQSPAVVVITDVEGNIEYVNPKFTETTGYTFDEVRGKNPMVLKSGHTGKEEYKKLWKTITSGKEWNGEFLNRKKNGELFCESASISPVMDKDGKITNFIAVKEDITEKKRAESMIIRIGRILEDSLNEIYIFDAKTLKYLEANHGARKNLGYTMEELSELTPVDLKPDMNKEDFEKILEPLRSGREEKIEFNAVHSRKDGTTFPVEIHLQTTTFESAPAFFSIILDQTKRMEIEEEKKKLHAQLLQAQKMEAVGVLAAGVAHDFNNILTIIRLRAENAMEEVGEESSAYEDMREACEASKNASDLTRQLLLFSRKQALEFVTGDLNATIAGLLKMLGRLIGENYSVKANLGADLKYAKIDKGGVEQMIVNLVINARDSMLNGGNILIETENVKIDRVELADHPDKKPGNFIRLSVVDKGVGIEKDIQEHIFEPFFTTKGVGKGTGLGLSVVYGIIMQHDGWVEVSSKAGKGTTFNLYIPASAENAQDQAENKIIKHKPDGDGRRILLVEDEAGLRQITAKLLRTSGFEVIEAEDYKQALSQFAAEKGNFDLLLSDVILPDKTGIELAEYLKGKKPDLKQVLCSGYTDDRSQWPLIRERGYKFLQKPYSLDELLGIIMETIEGN